jgi:hypothetical protein
MNGMNARGACVVEGWEYDKYSVSTHQTATSVTPDCSKDSPQKPAWGSRPAQCSPRPRRRSGTKSYTARARDTARCHVRSARPVRTGERACAERDPWAIISGGRAN